jgi:serine/threonine protein kinase
LFWGSPALQAGQHARKCLKLHHNREIHGATSQPALPNGHLLEEYTIDRQLSLGGFSIVYLAWRPMPARQVAIKEYCPTAWPCVRRRRNQAGDHGRPLGAFRYGMKCFFEEGRALARLSHPNVIRVLNFFRANETVYLVMEYEHGRTCRNSSRSIRATFPSVSFAAFLPAC